jgi:hypothetical protein
MPVLNVPEEGLAFWDYFFSLLSLTSGPLGVSCVVLGLKALMPKHTNLPIFLLLLEINLCHKASHTPVLQKSLLLGRLCSDVDLWLSDTNPLRRECTSALPIRSMAMLASPPPLTPPYQGVIYKRASIVNPTLVTSPKSEPPRGERYILILSPRQSSQSIGEAADRFSVHLHDSPS